RLDELGRRLLADRMRALPGMPAPGEDVPAEVLAERVGVAPPQRRLFGAVLEMLSRPATGPGPGAELAPHQDLLRRCVDALPDVLTGARQGVEVLFPGGSA